MNTKAKIIPVLLLSLLTASCLSEDGCGYFGSAGNLFSFLFDTWSGVNPFAVLPASMSSAAPTFVWVAESASSGPLSEFALNKGSTGAVPVSVLPGVHARGITEFSVMSPLYLWHDATVEVLDYQTATPTASITLVSGTQAVIQNFNVAHDGKFGYATFVNDSVLAIVDLTANKVAKLFDFGAGAALAAAVALDSAGHVYVLDAARGGYYTLDPNTFTYNFTLIAVTQTALKVTKPAVSPDGTRLWIPVAAAGSDTSAGTRIRAYDVTSNTLVQDILMPAYTNEIVFSPDGTSLYLLTSTPNAPGRIASINPSDGSTIWTTSTGVNPMGLALGQDGGTLLWANAGDGTVGFTNYNGGTMTTTKVGQTPVGVAVSIIY